MLIFLKFVNDFARVKTGFVKKQKIVFLFKNMLALINSISYFK